MSSLRSQTGRALSWDLLGNYGSQISNFIISIFLARLLEPEEFGLIGMSLVFISILRIFADLGFASALIQNKDNTSLTYSSIFYLNIFVGSCLTLLIYLTAPFIGNFYDNHTIVTIVQFLSIGFFISSFDIVQSTILRKELNFKSITIRDLISQLLAGVVSIILAYLGYGVYALVVQQILSSFIKTVLLWKIAGWTPKLEFSWLEVKKLTGFSAFAFAAQSMNHIVQQLDTLVVGKLFSPATLGFYSRANSVNNLISNNSVRSISKVFFPTLSSIQDDDVKFRHIYLKAINIVSGLSLFLTGFFFLCGEELIIGLFGIKWEPSVLIFKILILKGFTYPISAIIVGAFMGKGLARENFHYGNVRKVMRLVPLAVAFIYGFYPFLYAVVCASLTNWLLNNYFVTKTLKISFIDQLKAVMSYLVATASLVITIDLVFPDERNYLWAVTKVVLFSLLYVTYLYATRSVLLQEFLFYKNKIWQKLKTLLKKD